MPRRKQPPPGSVEAMYRYFIGLATDERNWPQVEYWFGRLGEYFEHRARYTAAMTHRTREVNL
jgi:hypothetical protein